MLKKDFRVHMQIQELILMATAKETFEDDDGLKVFKGQFFGERLGP